MDSVAHEKPAMGQRSACMQRTGETLALWNKATPACLITALPDAAHET